MGLAICLKQYLNGYCLYIAVPRLPAIYAFDNTLVIY
jgi:hypothetical protein